MREHGITQKYLETRSRALIRKKAIVSFDPVWRGRRFHAPESVLSLIGQEGREQAFNDQDMTPLTFQSTQIVITEASALCVGATIQTVRQVKPQSGRKRKRMGQSKPCLVSHFPHAIPNEAYERRRALLSAVCLSWSPLLLGSSFLAAGMRSGHVLLWKVSTLSSAVQKADASEHFDVLGATMASCAEISALEWALLPEMHRELLSNQLLLVTADVTGEVRVWTLDPQIFSSEQDCPHHAVLQERHLICAADSRPVSSLNVKTIVSDSGLHRLRICIGKYGGVLTVWENRYSSVDTCSTSFSRWMEQGKTLTLEGLHSHKAITGIASDVFLDCIVTIGLDSQLCIWKTEQEILAPCTSHYLQPFGDISDYQPCYGVAASPSGLMIATIRDLGEKYRDAQLQRMVWKRVAHGSIEIRRYDSSFLIVSSFLLCSLVDGDQDDAWTAVKDEISRRLHHGMDTALTVDLGYWLRMMTTENTICNDTNRDAAYGYDPNEAVSDSSGDDGTIAERSNRRSWTKRQLHASNFAQVPRRGKNLCSGSVCIMHCSSLSSNWEVYTKTGDQGCHTRRSRDGER